MDSFNILKDKLIHAQIRVTPYRNLPFKLICDAGDYAVGIVLWQRRDKHFQPIYYTLTYAQENYTTTKKELLATRSGVCV